MLQHHITAHIKANRLRHIQQASLRIESDVCQPLKLKKRT